MRIGLLGTGPWARGVHAPALAGHPGVEFAGVWGRRPEAAAEIAAEHGVPAYEDADKLIADVDAVAVALAPQAQAELALRAAEAGRHLLLDKPVALTVPQARRIADTVAAGRLASVVFFTLRFGGERVGWLAEQAARDGWFTARCDWLGAVFTTDSPYAASPWRREKGALWDIGPHALSLLLPVLGDAATVTAAAGPADTVHLVIGHTGGASSSTTVSLTAPPQAAGVALELRGEAGVHRLPEAGVPPVEAFGHAVDGLLAAARSGTPHPCDAAFGLRVVEILAAAEQSLTERATVPLQPLPVTPQPPTTGA
ncbi:Gfo/Idh/MocA family oxidoreductase [Kitasatospora sp. NPDC085895]|uniref:Gfo/Idh/MocA family protein n=1 Tax=Kitasatospora sp. NPDC085895 TaxID=3155057 RepID=UPI0034510C1C